MNLVDILVEKVRSGFQKLLRFRDLPETRELNETEYVPYLQRVTWRGVHPLEIQSEFGAFPAALLNLHRHAAFGSLKVTSSWICNIRLGAENSASFGCAHRGQAPLTPGLARTIFESFRGWMPRKASRGLFRN
jgi:hypothetical protein